MANKRVVLITFYDLDSFALHTLHAVLKGAGFEAHSIFFKSSNINTTSNQPTEREVADLIRLIKDIDPLIVGISFRSTFFNLALSITREIKKNLGLPVIWGGTHPTIRPQQCIEFTDMVCVGEGEGAIVELCLRLSKNEPLDNIQNVWVNSGDKVVKNAPRFLIPDLDTLPFPDFSCENKHFIDNGNIAPIVLAPARTNYWVMTSRGCPFSCTYCYNSIGQKIYKEKGQYVRRRSVENVIKELTFAKRSFKNLRYISFLDDLFTFNLDWIRKFHGEYKKEVGLPFYCHIHPKFTGEEMIGLLKDAGCVGMTMGVQSGSSECRHKYYERYESNEDIIRAAKNLHKEKIKCTYDLIMDNPLETDTDKRETFNLLLSLPRPFDLHIHSLTHFPETRLTQLLLERKIITEDDVEDRKQKSYKRWTPILDLDRKREDLFWDNLYYLAQNKHLPKQLLIWLSNRSFLKKHPKPFTFLLRLTCHSIYSIRSGSALDTLRWSILTILSKPGVLFKKRSWFFIWSRIKIKLRLSTQENHSAKRESAFIKPANRRN